MRELSTPRPLVIAEEAKAGFGEDAYAVGNTADGLCYMGVFDGCGGLGGRRYEILDNHTGAWTASRVTAYAAETYLINHSRGFDKKSCSDLQERIADILKKVKSDSTAHNSVQIGGDLKRNFPTTVSIAVAEELKNRSIKASFLWAGDSRGYFMDENGLCQLTQDDIETHGDDAFLNLREDGRLTNVANADTSFELHIRSIELNMPVILITATDGCFSYFKTPMEFENLLLETLMKSNTPQKWTAMINKCIKPIAGDDYTMALGLFGFSDFEDVKQYFSKRYVLLNKKYIRHAQNASLDELAALWESYKTDYYRRGLSWD